MASRPPNDPDYPKSPDQLDRGLRGPIGGVTRIGPRAFALAFFVICGLLVAILYGLNRGGPLNKATEAYASPPLPQSTNDTHFGQNVPIIATEPPATAAPPLVLPPTSVPNLDQAPKTASAPAPSQADTAAQQEEERRREAAEQRAAEEEAKRRELAEQALKSPILAGGNGSSGGGVQLAFAGNGGSAAGPAGSGGASGVGSAGGGGGAGGGASASGAGGRGTTHAQSTAYLDGPSGQYAVQGANVVLPEGGNPKDILQAQRFAPVSKFEIVAGSAIPASLITGIDSEIPGLVSGLVREDVYDSHTGKYLLIPRGSRLVGLYDNQVQYGQTRIVVAWQRLIFPDTTSIDLLNMPGNDTGGYAGFGGKVDNHFGLIFNAVLLTSAFAVGAELASPQTGGLTYNQTTGQLVSQSVGTQIAQTGTNIVNKDLQIPPVIHVAPGYPFIVFVDRDIVLPGVYHNQ